MSIELIVTTFAPLAITDETGQFATFTEAWRGASASANSSFSVRMPSLAFEALKPQLDKLSSRRQPAINASGARIAGTSKPILTYSYSVVPEQRPTVHEVSQTAPLSVSTDGVLVVRGTNLLGALPATLILYRQSSQPLPGTTGVTRFNNAVAVLKFTAVALGPIGNNIGVRVEAPSGAGSVTVTIDDDGGVQIVVVPAAAGPTATAVASQVNSSAAAAWVTATALSGSDNVPMTAKTPGILTAPQAVPHPYAMLTGGEGGGVAVADICVVDGAPANRLRITAQRGGNEGNNIAVVLQMSQGSNTVSVSGTTITVNRTGSTETLANLVSAINGNASAAALVKAVAVGTGSLGAVEKKYLNGGSGPSFTATIGGAAATITEHSDTSMTLSVAAASLVTAGIADGEHAALAIVAGERVLTGQIRVGSRFAQQSFGALSASLTYHTQFAAGAALDATTGFTRRFPSRTAMITLGSGAVATSVTLTGVNPRTGLSQTETIACSGAGTFQGNKAWETITRIQTDVDPEGTLDLLVGAGVYLGEAVDEITAVGVDGAYEAPAASSSAAEGVVRFTTVPNGTRTFIVQYRKKH